MASKHKSAPWFLKQGFFEGIKSFKEFEARTGKLADTVEMGDALEILVEAYLHLDEVMKAKDVWVVGSIPLQIRKVLNLPNDSKGIDGVYEDASGSYIPYQVKYRTDMDTLPYGEISAFLGITEKSLKDRVIFTNARKLSADVANRTGVRSVRADKFHELTEADFQRVHAWLTDKKVEPFKRWEPLRHQREAIEKITAGLKEADRTTAVMACGTGKTLVALWAAEAQKPKTVLVLVPSLALLSQTLPDWCKQTSWGERFRYLCVCSDASVDRSAKEDDYALRQQDLEFSVTTDAKVVKGFLADNKSGVNVIFSTYQSAEVVAEGLKGQVVDLGIFDEAHKTTGPKEGLFAFGLSDKNIRIKKRLFLTATPRHYNLHKRDKDGDFQTVSMSDESVYGKVSYRLPFSAAVAAGIIVPYKVIISVSLNKEVDAELLRRGSTRVRRDEIQAKWVANQIAVKRAIEKTGASKIITFHSRVNLAEDFAGDDAKGFKEHVSGFDVFHVNGSQNAADRKALLEGFKAAPKGLITNARCLTEGVDVPSVDMVAFVDPRKSKIDIAQAAGRAMRQSKATNKKLGYIVVPLFIEQKKGETEAEAFTRAGFDEVAEVLGAMLESDDDLVDTIEKMQEARGRGDKFNPRQLHEKIEVIGPAINLEKLTQSIDVEIIERLGCSWDFWIGLLQHYKSREGNCRVPILHNECGYKLGSWVNEQRRGSRRCLSHEQIQKLDEIGFSWNPRDEDWDLHYKALKDYHSREGHCNVEKNHRENGLYLGPWIQNQRTKIKSGVLNEIRLNMLKEIDFAPNPRKSKWEKSLLVLTKFKAREGHCDVPKAHKESDVNLGKWVSFIRQSKGRLSETQLMRLNSIGFIWKAREHSWDSHYTALRTYKNRELHCNVPQDHMERGLKLGSWVSYLRSKKDKLTRKQVMKINALGFDWNPMEVKWRMKYSALKKFHKQSGSCRVPPGTIVDGIKLNGWVSELRKKRSTLSAERVNLLDSIGFVWEVFTEQWDYNYSLLKSFLAREGHCRVNQYHVESGVRLGYWVSKQRGSKNQLSANQIKLLESINFSWDPFAEQWDYNCSIFETFIRSNGHALVPSTLEVNGVKLGRWVIRQRTSKTSLSNEQVKRLNSLGFIWKP